MKKVMLCILMIIFIRLDADKLVDQIGREVNLPNKIDRIVVLQHQSLNVLVQLDAVDKIVGVPKSWEEQLGKNYTRLAPKLKDIPFAGDLKDVNIEQILNLKPDVVIVANYFPKDLISKLESLKIPVVAISFFENSKNGDNQISPKFGNQKEEEIAYTKGLYSGIKLLGVISNKEKNANDLIKYIKKNQELLAIYSKKLMNKRVRLYMANPNFSTYGSGKYTNIIFSRAGGENVAANDIVGFKEIGIENLIKYNPDIIFVQKRYSKVADELIANKALSQLEAIKNGKIYVMPEFAKAWGYPTPEAMALGEFWVLKKLYPDIAKDINLDKMVDEYYKKFYRIEYKNN